MKRILVDASRCSGCRLCEMTCSFSHEKSFSSSSSRITVIKEDAYGFDLPIVCWHCNPCNAIENCPEKALERGKSLVLVNEMKCVGCGKCLETCTLGAIKLHPDKKTPLICNQCGGKPLCVKRCPTKALMYAETSGRKPKSSSQILKENLRRWGTVA